MSIIAYTGLPRSGKSYGVVEHVIEPAIKNGREVWTNIPMHDDVWIERHGRAPTQFKVDDLMQNKNWFADVLPQGAILVLDECWRVWPAGLKANNALVEHQEFLTMHGHNVGDDGFTTEIVLVTQDLNQLATFVRSLVEFTYRSVKLRVMGMDRKFRVDVYEGPAVGPNPPKSKRVSEQYYTYKKATYALYISHTNSTNGPGIEQNLDKRSSVISKWKMILMAIIFVPLIIFVFVGGKKVKDSYNPGGSKPVPDAQPSPLQLESTPSPQPVPVQRPQFADWLKPFDVYIVWNNGSRGRYDYHFSVRNRHGVSTVTADDLREMHYKIRGISHCFAVITINGQGRTVTCSRPIEQQPSLLPVDLAGN